MAFNVAQLRSMSINETITVFVTRVFLSYLVYSDYEVVTYYVYYVLTNFLHRHMSLRGH